MTTDLSLAFIGGGNMAAALAAGLTGRVLPAERIHVVDHYEPAHAAWLARGATVSSVPDARLAACDVWIYAVKPQGMREVVQATRPWRRNPLVVSVAAGIRAADIARWLGDDGQPWSRVVRCMPNTPALIGAGATGLAALPGVDDADRALAGRLLGAVGLAEWVADESLLDAVTALSGSGPAYVFLFLEALIEGGEALGLTRAQARALALATLSGATRLAAESDETPATLRERVTSKGGTTAAALDVLARDGFKDTVAAALRAASARADAMGQEFGKDTA